MIDRATVHIENGTRNLKCNVPTSEAEGELRNNLFGRRIIPGTCKPANKREHPVNAIMSKISFTLKRKELQTNLTRMIF